jgi:hypothetical protein
LARVASIAGATLAKLAAADRDVGLVHRVAVRAHDAHVLDQQVEFGGGHVDDSCRCRFSCCSSPPASTMSSRKGGIGWQGSTSPAEVVTRPCRASKLSVPSSAISAARGQVSSSRPTLKALRK